MRTINSALSTGRTLQFAGTGITIVDPHTPGTSIIVDRDEFLAAVAAEYGVTIVEGKPPAIETNAGVPWAPVPRRALGPRRGWSIEGDGDTPESLRHDALAILALSLHLSEQELDEEQRQAAAKAFQERHAAEVRERKITALAAEYGHPEVIRQLVEAGEIQ